MKTHLFSRGMIAALLATLAPLAHAQNEQSPIDIRPENAVLTTLAPLDFHYGSSVGLNVINNGSPDENATIRANVTSGSPFLSLSGTNYNLLQFHFHAPSEHFYKGHEYPMEMHMVHRDANNNLLVVGRWIEEGAFNPTLDPIFSQMPPDTSTNLPIASFDLNPLLPDDLSSFRYNGSLTTPAYAEGVKWVMLADPLEMSAAQIDAFEMLFPDGDAREPQPLNGRIIQTNFAPLFVPEPDSVAMLVGMGITGAGMMFRRRRR